MFYTAKNPVAEFYSLKFFESVPSFDMYGKYYSIFFYGIETVSV